MEPLLDGITCKRFFHTKVCLNALDPLEVGFLVLIWVYLMPWLDYAMKNSRISTTNAVVWVIHLSVCPHVLDVHDSSSFGPWLSAHPWDNSVVSSVSKLHQISPKYCAKDVGSSGSLCSIQIQCLIEDSMVSGRPPQVPRVDKVASCLLVKDPRPFYNINADCRGIMGY